MLLASPASAQSVAAAGQLPAKPGRFGFSLECVKGCSWVEPGIDQSYFRFKGEPRVSAVEKGGSAERAGLKVGEILVEVDSEHVTSIPAGLTLASDSVERLLLTVQSAKGRNRQVTLWAVRVCTGSRGLLIQNHSAYDVEVLMITTRRSRVLSRVAPGRTELPIPLSDSVYRAAPPTFYVRLPSWAPRVRSNARSQLWSTRVLCHDG